MGSAIEEDYNDMTLISNIDQDQINLNLKKRYEKDKIYTYIGSILIAVNPYKYVDLYNKDAILKYAANSRAELDPTDPHVYALVQAAYKSLTNNCQIVNQSCVISGESGAGKTETTKFILHYLCSVSSNVSAWVQQQIIEANTILEAFGNAKTVRNDNSSRFGKFIQVCFDHKYDIKGCVVHDYLLEQSRITFQSKQERNYHVFYQFVANANQNRDLAEQFLIEPMENYVYLSQSDCLSIEGVNDAILFDNLRLAFNVLNIEQEMCDGIFSVLSAILWLGNLRFIDIDGEHSGLTENDKLVLSNVAMLIGFDFETLFSLLLTRQINVRGNVTDIPLRLNQVSENRHAMAKALYSRTFAWLVNRINTCTQPGQNVSRFIGVLDIFGFENFEVNSFEQLCINYTNERLHKFFNHYVFAVEQEMYAREEISYSHITFTDNSSCLDLLERSPRGLLKLLAEECRMPKGSDATFLEKLQQEMLTHSNYIKGDDKRKWDCEFGIRHYAGAVSYNVGGFINKNKDCQLDTFFFLMNSSRNKFVRDLVQFQDLLDLTVSRTIGFVSNGTATISRTLNKAKPTVGEAFKHQLITLIDVLQNTNPWYVKCIKPNCNKMSDYFDDKLVLTQLHYLGMVDITRIRREGYPIHYTIEDFLMRYRCLVSESDYFFSAVEYTADNVCRVMQILSAPTLEWQVGRTKVFMRSTVHGPIELQRTQIRKNGAILIQNSWRRHKCQTEYVRRRTACVKIQRRFKTWRQRIDFLRKRRATVVIQKHLRGLFGREVAIVLRRMRQIEAEAKRQKELELLKLKQEEELKTQKEFEDRELQLQQSLRAVKEEIAALLELSEKNAKRNQQTQSTNECLDLDDMFAFLTEMQENKLTKEEQYLADISNGMDELTTQIQQLNCETIDKQSRVAEWNESNQQNMRVRDDTSTQFDSDYHEGDYSSDDEVFELPPPSTVDLPYPTPQVPPVRSPRLQPVEVTKPVDRNDVMTTSMRSENSALPVGQRGRSSRNRSKSPRSPNRKPLKYSGRASCNLSRSSTEQNIIIAERVSAMRMSSCGSGMFYRKTKASLEESEHEYRRKQRIDKIMQHMIENPEDGLRDPSDDIHYDLIEFADKYFNNHLRGSDGSLVSRTLNRSKRKSSVESYVPKYEMITFTKSSTIQNSHVHLYDPDNIAIACSIFKDLCKYLRGEIAKSEFDTHITIQNIIKYGLEREELRDEIYCQLMRQVNNNSDMDAVRRVWILISLSVVAFYPSKILLKYFVSFLKKNIMLDDGCISHYAKWCLVNVKTTKATNREMPPSSAEIQAVSNLNGIVCRFNFLDGSSKAIDIHPSDTAVDAMHKLAARIQLLSLDGWALYQNTIEGEYFIRGHEYIADIIAQWEKNNDPSCTSAYLSMSKIKPSEAPVVGGGSVQCNFIFKKRLFRMAREISQDPVEISLLYAQAVHNVVRCDVFPLSEKMALQLAGLEAQIALGEFQFDKLDWYSNIENYIPSRIRSSRNTSEWITAIAEAHRLYGSGKSEIVSKVWYLSSVMQYPHYGCSFYKVLFKGYWNYGSNNILLGVKADGVLLFNLPDKSIIAAYLYEDLESVLVDSGDNFITFQLCTTNGLGVASTQQQQKFTSPKCLVFETKQKHEIAQLISSYSPVHGAWIKRDHNAVINKQNKMTNEDRMKLYHDVIHRRRYLVENNLLRKPADESATGFIMNTLRKFKRPTNQTIESMERSYWSFSKEPIKKSITIIHDAATEQVALNIFNSILLYSGLKLDVENNATNVSMDDLVVIAQQLIECCMKNDVLLNEFYMQLVKQTTDHPDANGRVNIRNWQLLCLSCSIVAPTSRPLLHYVQSNLRRCSYDTVSQEGLFAQFALKYLMRTIDTRKRQWPPSRQEILCTINRRYCYTRFYLLDSNYMSVEFDSSANAEEVLENIRQKLGLRSGVQGYAIYEVLGNAERALLADEKLTDAMFKWERYSEGSWGQPSKNSHTFLVKKHLMLDSYIDWTDSVERELLYYQLMHNLRNDKVPITQQEALLLCALKAQNQYGDASQSVTDYKQVIADCMPIRLANTIDKCHLAVRHQSMSGMDKQQTKQMFINILVSWPLHKSTIFNVVQNYTSAWPKALWLAVDQKGIHLLEQYTKNLLCFCEYESIASYSPSLTSLMIVTGNQNTQRHGAGMGLTQTKYVFNTNQATNIAHLINDYARALAAEGKNLCPSTPDFPTINLLGLGINQSQNGQGPPIFNRYNGAANHNDHNSNQTASNCTYPANREEICV